MHIPSEIVTTLVGTLLGGSIATGGIYVTNRLERDREQWGVLQNAVHDLTLSVPIALAYLGTNPPSPNGQAFGTPGWDAQQRVTASMLKVDLITRKRRRKRFRIIRRAADDLQARLTAARLRAEQGKPLTFDDMTNISANILVRAVMGRRQVLDDAIEKYMTYGFPEQEEEH